MERIGPELLGRLFDAHAAALTLYARQWCDSPEDVVQEAFLALAGQRTLPERAVAWLHRAVRNAAIDASRRARRRQRREQRAASPEGWFSATEETLDARWAGELLAELDEPTREVVVARLWGGLTFDEIARLQGSSVSATHRRYHAGLDRLHARLEPPCPIPTATN